MTVPVIAVVGLSGSGKTRVAGALVEILAARGYRIAAVKHCPHGHQVDRPGKDSARLFSAGASQVVLSSPGQKTSIERIDTDSPLEEIVASLEPGYNLVVAEGFKGSSVPKVLVLGKEDIPLPDRVIAVVGDRSKGLDVPSYTFQQMEELAGQIKSQFLDGGTQSPAVSLLIDGVPIPLTSFPQRALIGVIQGFLQSLKNVPQAPQRISIEMGGLTATDGHKASPSLRQGSRRRRG